MKRSRMKKNPSKHDWKAMAEMLYERSGGLCECCRDVWIQWGYVRAENIHHILPRSKVGKDSIENLLFVCGSYLFLGGVDSSCHTKIHSEPKWAKEKGFLK